MLKHRIIIGILTVLCMVVAINYAVADDLFMTIAWGIGTILEAILLSIITLNDANVSGDEQ